MLSKVRWAFLVVVFLMIAGAVSPAWAYRGYGWGPSRGFSNWSNYSPVSYGRYWGSRNYWGSRYYAGYSGYRNYGWPYGYYRNNYYRSNFYRPYVYGYSGFPFLYGYYNSPGYYGYAGYPSYYYGDPSFYYSYPSDCYVDGDHFYFGDASPAQEYVVSRPVSDVAQVQFRLPDPQATLWVQGQQMVSSGTVRQFKSPQLDPSQRYTYNVKAQWNNNGKLVADERQVQVQANQLSIVDFTQPTQAAPDAPKPAPPALPPPQAPAAVE